VAERSDCLGNVVVDDDAGSLGHSLLRMVERRKKRSMERTQWDGCCWTDVDRGLTDDVHAHRASDESSCHIFCSMEDDRRLAAASTCSKVAGPRPSLRRLHRIHPLTEAVSADRPQGQPRAFRSLEEKGIPCVDEEAVSRLFEKYCYDRTPDEATCSCLLAEKESED
jgi:hypothetical protein